MSGLSGGGGWQERMLALTNLADETAKSDRSEAAQARRHRDQDMLAARERAGGGRGGLLGRLKRLFRR
jgi:hypothetical protein